MLEVNRIEKLRINRMREIKFILSLFLLVTLISCSSNEKDIKDTLFNIEGLKTDISSIKNQGYKWEKGIDLIIYSKKINDTLISLELNNPKGDINTKSWKIKLDSNESDLIYKRMLQKGVFPNGPISYYENDEGYFFTVIRNSDNNIFTCKVLNENNSSYLYVTYNVPR